MLAPRKTLWSTPSEVVGRAIEWGGRLDASDCVCDIGCGDGRCLVQWATHYSKSLDRTDATGTTAATTASFVGIDINHDRIQQARQSWKQAVIKGEVHENIKAEFYCMNALEAYDIFCRATVVFLYLIPRGLRKIKPMLEQIPHPIQVITYMSPLPDEIPLQTECIKVPHQPNAEWPVFAYRLGENNA
eukprot:scaffold4726_cov156-Amphora_coffeaeformis.AAC.4